MANCNPVISVMDWTENAKLHKRYIEWKEDVELELRSSLSNISNSVKSNYVLRWAGKPGTRIRVHVTAIIVEHQTGPGSTQRYVRLETLYVVGVERKGTLIHYAEALGHPYTY